MGLHCNNQSSARALASVAWRGVAWRGVRPAKNQEDHRRYPALCWPRCRLDHRRALRALPLPLPLPLPRPIAVTKRRVWLRGPGVLYGRMASRTRPLHLHMYDFQ